MNKKILSLAVVSTLSLGSLLSPMNPVSAAKISELKEQKQEINSERSTINAEINEKKSKIGELQTEQQKINAQIKSLDMAVEDASNKITAKNAEIETTNAEVEKLKGEIAVLIERINKRNELLKDKARSFQENGGTISYMDVLLGAQSFSDFVDRVNAVATIVEADKDILEQHRLDKVSLETKQKEVETKLSQLIEMKKELEALKVQLNGQIAEKNKLMSTLKHEEEQMHAEAVNLEEESQILAAQEAALQQAIKLEQQRQAALAAERARQEAELARQRAAQAQAAKNNNNSGGGSQSAPEPSVQAAPPVSNGAFMMPANGRLTSGIGQRWGSFHAGIDIANKASNVPIVAAADGVVIKSYYSSSYGNAIFIAHSVNGQTYTTVYAHMSNRSVGSGAVVSKGQRIGTMGNTGQSYGQHLHFELHRGSWNAAKSNAINPLSMM